MDDGHRYFFAMPDEMPWKAGGPRAPGAVDVAGADAKDGGGREIQMSEEAILTNDNVALAEISKAQLALERANDIHEMIDLRDQACAFQVLANARGFKEAAQQAKIFQLKAERKAGDWLDKHVKHNGGDPETLRQVDGAIPDGIDENESRRWQLEAKVPEETFNAWIDDCLAANKEITAFALQRIGNGMPHVSFNSGDNEWYTPPEYIEAARRVMGEIDLDPASSDKANEIVKARVYFTANDNGLRYAWDGRVWMNPPYSGDLIGHFTNKLAKHYKNGEITEAIVLVNNATETTWFQGMLQQAAAVCFVKQRIKFIDMNGNPSGAPLQGQAVLYFGEKPDIFSEQFGGFGIVLWARNAA